MFARLTAALAIGLIAATTAAAQAPDTSAQSYPNRPVRLVVPFPAGGPTDILSRVVAQRLSEVWGQPVVIENQPGANTAIAAAPRRQAGARRLHAARRHGRRPWCSTRSPTRTCPTIRSRISRSITLAAKNTSLLTVRADDGPKTVQELIARAKANPGKLNYGAGIITTRLAGYLFNREAGIDVQYIPFNGSAADRAGPADRRGRLYRRRHRLARLPLIKSGQLRALAKLNSRPLPALPDVRPLSVEANIPALDDISTWIGFVAPAGTPRADRRKDSARGRRHVSPTR